MKKFLVLGLGVVAFFAVASIANAQFVVGDRVQTTALLNVRSSPGGSLLGTQGMGAYGTIVGGPVSTSSYTWWQVNYDNPPDGWSVGDYLIKSSSTTSSTPSITVLYPNGGESLEFGKTYKVRWTSNNLPPGSPIEVAISSGPTYDFFSTIHNHLVNDGEDDITIVSPVRSDTYKILVASPNQSLTIPPIARDESDSTFSIVAAQQGGMCGDLNGDGVINVTDVSAIINYVFRGTTIPVGVNADVNGDGVVNVLDVNLIIGTAFQGAPVPTGCGQLNQPPEDRGFSGPSNLNVGQLGTWYVGGYDPEGGVLSYTLFWGDGTSSIQSSVPSEQQRQFTHTYSQPGIYSVVFRITDSFGAYIERQLSVVNVSATNQPPVVNSFTGPNSLTVGQVGTWTAMVSDPDSPSLNYYYAWGDGTPSEYTFNVPPGTYTNSYVYNKAGNFNVTFAVTDPNSSTTATRVLTVVVNDPATLSVTATSLGPTTNRVKSAVDNLANINFTAGSNGAVYVNRVRVNFAGTVLPVSGAATFLNGVNLIDENGVSLGTKTILDSCSGGPFCYVNFDLGSGNLGQLVDTNTLRRWTLRVNSILTNPGQAGVTQTLSATLVAVTSVKATDVYSGVSIQPNFSVPLPINSVSYAAGTYTAPPPIYQPTSGTVTPPPTTPPPTAPTTVTYQCGDLDKSGTVNTVDVKLIYGYWVGGVPIPAGVNADMNGDGVAGDVLDYSLLNNYVNKGGVAPTCGVSSGGGGTKTNFSPSASVLSAMQSQLDVIRNQLISILQSL